ncbi:MAG: hypothetical protein ACLS8R_06770 [Anaeromassilibacillus sp.]
MGIMHFAGLTYSKPNAGGATSDILMPDITDPTVRPCIRKRSAMRLHRSELSSKTGRKPSGGHCQELPVTILNDLNEDLDGLEVTLTVERMARKSPARQRRTI